MTFKKQISIMHNRLLSPPILKLKEKDEYFGVFAGIYYGYPDCCITNFSKRMGAGNYKLTPEQEKAHNYVGFIPCPKCAKKVVAGKITQASLIKDRVCSQKFPNDNENASSLLEYDKLEKELSKKKYK